MDVPKARLKLEEAQFFYGTLRKYLFSDSGLNLNDTLGRKHAGFHFSAFIGAVDSVFEVIQKRYKLTHEQYEAWLSDVSGEADRTQRRREMNDLRHREVHDASITLSEVHTADTIPTYNRVDPTTPVVVTDPQATVGAPQLARLTMPHAASETWKGDQPADVWAATLSAPGTWADGREVLDVCQEYLRLADGFVRWCEGLDETRPRDRASR